METIVIVVDNLRVGGIQRIALDEAYSLADREYKIEIIHLEKRRPDDDIVAADYDFFPQFSNKIHLHECSGTNLEIFRKITAFLKQKSPKIVICHSAKAMPITFFSRQLLRKPGKMLLLGYVHQLITLSRLTQRVKRVIYFHFCDDLRASSNQFVLEMQYLRKRNLFFRLIAPKAMMFDRMGIYLPRIDYFQNREHQEVQISKPSILFLSRVVGWKGFDKYLHVVSMLDPDSAKVVFAPSIYKGVESLGKFESKKNSLLVLDSQVARLKFLASSLHLYPTNYGEKVRNRQNIGMNVLECIALGIPTLITEEDFLSWPELRNSPLVEITNWDLKESVLKANRLLALSSEIKILESKKLRSVVSIEKHIESIEQFARIYS